MAKTSGLSKLQQGKILAYASVKMTVRAIAKAIGHSKSAVHAFPKDPDSYGTKKSPRRPRQLKIHDRTRLRRYAATGEYTVNELQKELYIDASVRTVQRELQHCKHLAYEKANKSPCITERHMKLRVEWVDVRGLFQTVPKPSTHAWRVRGSDLPTWRERRRLEDLKENLQLNCKTVMVPVATPN